MAPMRRIVVAITGASGSIYGLRTVEVLAKAGDVEIHLIVSRGAVTTIQHELDRPVSDITALADFVHDDGDLAASIASGSFRVDGMVVAAPLLTIRCVSTSPTLESTSSARKP